MTTLHPPYRTLAACALACAMGACTSILGLDDVTYSSPPGGGGSSDNSEAGPASPPHSAADASPGAACSNTLTDRDNCGACGHACLPGTACADSLCEPRVLADVQGGEPLGAIAIGEGRAYFVGAGRLFAHPLDGGTTELRNASAVDVVFEDGLYVTESPGVTNSALRRCPLAGMCGDAGVALASGLQGAGALSIAGNWAVFAGFAGTSDTLEQCTLAGCDGGARLKVPSMIFDVVTTGTRAFWVSASGLHGCVLPCTSENLTVASQPAAWRLAHVADEIFVAVKDQRKIQRCVDAACSALVDHVLDAGEVDLIASDGTNLYWSTKELTRGSATIRRSPVKPGGPTLTIARGAVVGGLVLDDQRIYYTDTSTNRIFMNAK